MDIFLSSFLWILGIQVLFFLLASSFKTDKVTDLSYGLTFVIVSWVLFVKNPSFKTMFLLVMMLFWGVRLSSYLFIRIIVIGKDKRFDGIREDFFSFARFWLLQAVSIFIILLPSIIVFGNTSPFSIWSLLGIIVWMKGFTIESIADMQKFIFKQKNKDGFMKEGLFRYSQFPNYFGEMLVWLGIYLYSVPYLSGFGFLSVISPVFIAVLLLFVTGIPPLKKGYKKKYGKEYERYERQTSLLVPWPSRKS
jgi:steroid 5-alpha reductase family enzyme